MKLSSSIQEKQASLIMLRRVALLIVASVLALSGYTIWSGYLDALEAAEISTTNHAKVLQVQIDASLRRLDSVLTATANQIPEAALQTNGDAVHGKAIQTLLDASMIDFSEVVAIRVVDSRGAVRYSSPYVDSRGFNSSDRDFFIEPRDNPKPHLFFSTVTVSRITGKQVMVVSRALRNTRGEFYGLVSAGVSVDAIQNQFRKINVGKHGSIALRRIDNLALVVRWPHFQEEVNKPLLPNHPVHQNLRRGEHQFSSRTVAQTDGRERIFGTVRLEQFPFIVIVAYDVKGVLAYWHKQTLMISGATLGMILVLLELLRRYWRSQQSELSALRELAQNQARVRLLAQVFENSGEAIMLLDQQQQVVEVNLAYTRLSGFSKQQVLHQPWQQLLQPPPAAQSSGAGVWPNELQCQRQDGSQFPVLYTRASFSEDDQELAYTIINFTDISERKRVEQMKSEFVSTVSHELRTPLTSICGGLGLLVGGALGSLPPAPLKILNIAHANSLRLSVLINDLLDMEKLAAGKMEMSAKVQALMPLVEQVLEANQSFAQAHQVSLQLQQRFEATVEVDGARLQQVLSNLISNAAKFSPEHTQVQVLVSQHGNQVRVAVQDQGPGIPAEFQQRIFQKFAQADSADTRLHGGTGLGLAISKQLIEQMHGSIGFSSVEGEGALFYIDLPLCQP